MQYSDTVERLLRYVKIDTQSQKGTGRVPSTEKQKDLGRLLMEELTAMGAEEVRMDAGGCVSAVIPATNGGKGPVVGFLAHMDTSPDAPGTNVQPRIIESYPGGDIVLNEKKSIVLKREIFTHLDNYIGDDLIVTDGTTLLGADDKAGVACIMHMAAELLAHPEIPHGKFKLGFTTDEEIGSPGAKQMDVKAFGCDFAYTLDGQTVGEINAESFNAADAEVVVHGVQVHPGRAKNKMINATAVAREFDALIPAAETCEHSEGREGYYHMHTISGGVSLTTMKYFIRDFETDGFAARKQRMRAIAEYLNSVYGPGTVEVKITDTYYTMLESIKPIPEILEKQRAAIRACGFEPREVPIRGGTDGSVLSGRGLPSPNLSVGYQNGHSVYEYCSVRALDASAEILLTLAKLYK